MKKRFAAVLTSLLLLMLLVPAAAFATGGHTVNGDLNLKSGTTLKDDGYTWDASTNTLTMQDLTVMGNINLPNAECTINVKGNCSVEEIRRGDSDAAQAVTIKGETGAVLNSSVSVPGSLTLDSIVLTGDRIWNSTTNQGYILKVENSNITLHHQLMWMTADGMELINSSFKLDSNTDSGQFWVQKIAMDKNSIVESYRPMQNYGHFTPNDLGEVNNYIAEPAGGSFQNKGPSPNATDHWLTVVDKEGNIASHFILRAPKEQCEISPQGFSG